MKMFNEINYKKALETVSRGMIMIHDPHVLIKFIIRMIVGKLKIKHAGVILYDPDRDTYVLSISKGEPGQRIPAGFARFESDNPLVRIFQEKRFRPLYEHSRAVLAYDIHKIIWKEGVLSGKPLDADAQAVLHEVGEQMQMMNAVACVPAIYHRHLLAILLLGEKEQGGAFHQDELDFFAALASDAAMAIRNAQLFNSLKEHAEKSHDLFIRMTTALGAAIEAKDKYTRGHSEGVTRYAVAIARYMRNHMGYDFSDAFFENIYIAGTLHDIGKIGVPEAILNKPGRLTPEEYDLIKKHPQDGVDILEPLSELKESMAGILYHHERFDGKGYPKGIKGDEIPMIACIIAVADTFDAMVTQRLYRFSITPQQAIEEIRLNKGTQFHPDPAEAMIQLFENDLLL